MGGRACATLSSLPSHPFPRDMLADRSSANNIRFGLDCREPRRGRARRRARACVQVGRVNLMQPHLLLGLAALPIDVLVAGHAIDELRGQRAGADNEHGRRVTARSRPKLQRTLW